MNIMGTANIQQRTESKGSILPSWGSRFMVVGIIGLSLTAALVYWRLDTILEWVGPQLGRVVPIAEWFQDSTESTLSLLGLGTIAVGVWLMVVLALARWRPIWYAKDLGSWLINLRLWLSSVGLLGLSLAVMAFLPPISGALGGFNVPGSASLSGQLGEIIIGETFWIGVLRTVGVGMATIMVVVPKTSVVFLKKLATGVLRRLLTCYVFVILGFPLLGTFLRRLFLQGTVRPPARPLSEVDSGEVLEAQLERNMASTETSAEVGQDLLKVADVVQYSSDSSYQVNTQSTELISPDEELDDGARDTKSSYDPDAVVPSSVKFNKYWSEIKTTATTLPTTVSPGDFGRNAAIEDRQNIFENIL